jgi:hypothetical protein
VSFSIVAVVTKPVEWGRVFLYTLRCFSLPFGKSIIALGASLTGKAQSCIDE